MNHHASTRQAGVGASAAEQQDERENPRDVTTPKARALPGPIPRLVLLSSLTVLALSFLGTVVLPLLIVPDEKHHADMVLMVREGTWIEMGWPGLGERLLDPAIVDASLSLGPREAALRENRAAQHPPLFYLAAALTSSIVTMPIDDLDLEVELWSFRLLSVLATAILPLTFYLIAVELTDSRPTQIATAFLPLTIPGITLRDGSMINNDALLIALTSLAILFAVRIAKGSPSLRTSAGLGFALGLAALTKGNALVFLPVPIVSYAILAFKNRRTSAPWLRSLMMSSLISLLVGGWWWIRNLLLYGSVQPIRDLDIPEPMMLDWPEWFGTAIERIVGSFWGGQFALGGRWYMPLFWALSALFVVTAMMGWWRARDRAAASVAGLYAFLLIPAVLVVSATLYAERGRVAGVHGRYFFPGIAGAAPLVILGVGAVLRPVLRWLPALVATGSAVMTALALEYMLRRYWSPSGTGLDDRWLELVAASPIPQWMTIGALALTFGCFFALLVGAMRAGLLVREGQIPNSNRASTPPSADVA